MKRRFKIRLSILITPIISILLFSFFSISPNIFSSSVEAERQAMEWLNILRKGGDYVQNDMIEERLIEMGPELLMPLISVLDNSLKEAEINREFVLSLIRILGEMHDPRVVTVLVKATYIVDWIIREESVYRLISLMDANPGNLDILIAILGSNDPDTQFKAKEKIMDMLQSPDVATKLIETLRHHKYSHENVGLAIIDILNTEPGQKDFTDCLFSVLDDNDEAIRKKAVLALNNMGQITGELGKDELLKVLDIIKDDIILYEIWNKVVGFLDISGSKDINFLVNSLEIAVNSMHGDLQVQVKDAIIRIGTPALKRLREAVNNADIDSPFQMALLDLINKIGKGQDIGIIEKRLKTEGDVPAKRRVLASGGETNTMPIAAYLALFLGIAGPIAWSIYKIIGLIRFNILRLERWGIRKVDRRETHSYYKVPTLYINISGLHFKDHAEPKKECCNLCGSNNFKIISRVVINDRKFLIVQCMDDGLIWRTPLLSLSILKYAFGKQYFKSSIPLHFGYANYEKMRREREYLSNMEMKLVNEFKKGGDGYRYRLLDIGCSSGDLLIKADENGWDAKGLEVSSYAIKRLIPRVNHERRKEDKGELNIFYGTLNDFVSKPRIKEDIFDVVTAFEVIELVSDPLAFLSLTKRVLKGDGHIVIGISGISNVNNLKRLGENQFHISEGNGIRMIEKAGFALISVRSINKNGYNFGKILIGENRA